MGGEYSNLNSYSNAGRDEETECDRLVELMASLHLDSWKRESKA